MVRLFDIGFAPIQKRTGMGLQYIGSKEAIAPNIINEIAKYQPNATHAFDLFGGGGAMSLAFVASGLTTTYNELKSDMPQIYEYVLDCVRNPRNKWGIFDTELYYDCPRDEYKRIYQDWKADKPLSVKELMWRYTFSFNCKGTTHYTDADKSKFGTAGHTLAMLPHLQLGNPNEATEVFVEHLSGLHESNDPSIIRRLIKETYSLPHLTKLGIYDRRLFYRSFWQNLETLCILGILDEFKDFNANRLQLYNQSRLLARACIDYPHLIKPDACTLAELQGWTGMYQLVGLERLERFERVTNIKSDLLNHPMTITNKSYADFDMKAIADELKLEPQGIVVYCFSDDTEIFTDSGWKLLSECNIESDRFLSRNPETDELKFLKATHYIKRHYDGDMYHYNGRSVDLLVTPEHRLFMSHYSNWTKKTTHEFIRAEDFFGKHRGLWRFIAAGGKWKGNPAQTIDVLGTQYNAEDFAYLLGVFITDGSVNNKGIISICQVKPNTAEKIQGTLNRLGMKHTRYKNRPSFNISRKYLPYFQQFYLKTQRRIPNEIKQYNTQVLRSLLEGIIDGDGTRDAHKSVINTCLNKGLVDDICEVIYKVGYLCHVSTRESTPRLLKSEGRVINATKPYYHIRINTTKYRAVYPHNESLEYYNGLVYCLALEDWHTVLVRRNGKSIWCGQCDIPYQKCNSNINDQVYAQGFDVKEYVEWAKKQTENGFNVFLSEYDSPNPEVFKEIAAWQKISATTKEESQRTEKLFLAEGKR